MDKVIQFFTTLDLHVGPVELAAIIFTAASVFLTIRKSIWLYPVGIVGTILYFFVFLDAKLYSSVSLQVWYTVIQLYGWWFWLKGDNGNPPLITRWPVKTFLGTTGAVVCIGAIVAYVINHTTNAAAPYPDTILTGLSVWAQFLLDRKKIENWIVWFVVDVIAVYTYFTQHLNATGLLYVAFTLGTLWGFHSWYKTMKQQVVA